MPWTEDTHGKPALPTTRKAMEAKTQSTTEQTDNRIKPGQRYKFPRAKSPESTHNTNVALLLYIVKRHGDRSSPL